MENLELLLSRALDAVIGMGPDGRVTAWNGAAEEIFGWSKEQALGAVLGELIVPAQHREHHTRGLEHYNRTGEGPVLEKRIKITALHQTGVEFPVELSIFAINHSDQQHSFYAFVRDRSVEEVAQREQELRAREATAVMNVGQKLIEDVPLDDFIQFCLDEVCDIANMDAGHLYVVRGEGSSQVLEPSGIWCLRDERYRPVVEATSGLQFKPGQGLPGRAWQSGGLEALENLIGDCKFLRREVFTEVGLTRGVALAVPHGGNVHAVLEFFGTDSSRMDPEILRLVKTVGSQVGAAIRRRQGAESRETLRNEMVHRVSNSLSILSSIYRQCSRQARSIQELDDMFLGRIIAIGRANKTSIVEAERGVFLPDLIKESLAMLPDHDKIVIDAPPIMICREAVMPLSLILHELGTNALKYGGLGGGDRLYIQVSNADTSDVLRLDWEERRREPLAAPPEQPERRGFGSRLIQTMVEGRLGGRFERRLDETGFHFNAHFFKDRLEALNAKFGP
ncbi:PAS domain S-box protein [Sulfitobacter sp. NFXS29]|uniref:PAS domain S-box protein n=1 Tax=Sulfitobacter sp. NFXS29 TaxID=2818438 RepID=UPI0032DFC33E